MHRKLKKKPSMEPKTCQKGPKIGSEYWPTFKTAYCMRTVCALRAHCVRTACMAFPMIFPVSQSMGLQYGQTPKQLHCVRTALKAPPAVRNTTVRPGPIA